MMTPDQQEAVKFAQEMELALNSSKSTFATVPPTFASVLKTTSTPSSVIDASTVTIYSLKNGH